MAQPTLLAIVNPLSGTASIQDKQNWIQFLLKKATDAGFTPEAVFTQHPGHATELAANAMRAGIRRVVIIGGDGSVNETARAILNSQTALGIVPVGSGNGLARHLGLSLNPRKAIEQAVNGRPVVIDSGRINEHPFFCTTGIGFDAYVAHAFAKQPVRGLPTYIRTAYQAFWHYKPVAYEIDRQSHTLFSLTVANAGQFGNNAWIAPKANVSDGLLDVCYLKPFPRQAVAMLAWQLFNKTLDQSSYLSVRPARSVEVKGAEPLLIHVDGEPILLETATAMVQVVPSSLLVIR
ncbi:diacylglycerol/lipid kinase family protein [Larkinella terrae]|uniref:Diacylglycerol kinase n=1 Tax=Larkinella terrae TaxID=2025311 RepID=A0A7K0ELG7_9BACT|nr:diacylglycerol kinase family protein [Larkinella terrae]MRS62346.1 diacylglycerol kinase [Larkinella terrae]